MDPDEYWPCVDEVAGILGAPHGAFRELWHATFSDRMRGDLRDGHHVFEHLLGELGVRADAEALEGAITRWTAFHQSVLTPREGALECLDALRARGCLLGLVTDCSSQTPDLLDRTPLGAYFPVRAASAHLRITKPHPDTYGHVLTGLGVRGDRCLYVGDGNSGELPGAKRLGMTTVWLDNQGAQHWKHGFVGEGDYTVSDLREVPAIVDRVRAVGRGLPEA